MFGQQNVDSGMFWISLLLHFWISLFKCPSKILCSVVGEKRNRILCRQDMILTRIDREIGKETFIFNNWDTVQADLKANADESF